MKNKLETPLQKLARITSKKYGLKVIYQGEGAYVDLENNIMSLPVIANEKMTELIHGYLDHEVGHIKHTDKNFNMVKFSKGKNPLVNSIGRLLEDVRVDAKVSGEFLGCKENINKTRLSAYAKCLDMAVEAGEDRDAIYQMDILEYLAGRMTKSEMCETATEGVEKAKDLFERVGGLEDIRSAFELAQEIVKRWGEEDPPEEEQDQSDEGEQGENNDADNSDESDSGDDNSSGGENDTSEGDSGEKNEDNSESESEDQDGSDGSGEDSEDQGDGDDGSQESEGESGEEDGQDGNSGDENPSEGEPDGQDESFLDQLEDINTVDAGNSMEEAINKMIGEIGYTDLSREHVPFSTEYDNIRVEKDGDVSDEKDIRVSAKESAGMLIRRLEMSLKAINRARDTYEQERGQIDARRLHALSAKTSNRVFKKRVEAETEDTAVYLLVDCSGSMGAYCGGGYSSENGTRIGRARVAACAFSKCLDTLGIPNEVAGFWTSYGSKISNAYTKYLRNGGRKNYFTRTETLINHKTVKTFDDSFEAGAFSALQPTGANFDGESVMIAANFLAKRPEKRKILMVFSDGRPVEEHYSNRCITASDYLTKKIKEINSAGIHTIGIGIGDDCVKEFYPDYVVLEDAEKLSAVTIKQIERILLSGQAGRIKKEVA